MKKVFAFISVFTAFAMMNLSVASASVTSIYPKGTSDHVNVYVNDTSLQMDVPARIINNRTMVPLRAICEALGAQVEWEPSTNAVVVSKGETTIELKFGSKDVTVNGQQTTLDVAPQVINNRTMVPLHFLSSTLGAHVGWSGSTESVFVSLLPLPTLQTVHTYIQSTTTYTNTFLSDGMDAYNLLSNYLNKKISYSTFESQFPAKVKDSQNSVTAIKNIPVPDDPTVQKLAETNNKILQESVDYLKNCENAIYSDHIDQKALKSAYADMATINADADAYFAEFTYQ